MGTSSRRLDRAGLHPALVPILVGSATALVIGLARREGRFDPVSAHQAASGDISSQALKAVPAASPASFPLVDRLQHVVLASGQADTADEDDSEIERQMPKYFKKRPLIGQEEFDAARKLYDEQDYVAARKALQKLLFTKRNLPIEDHALFYLAECDFQLGQYPAAQEGYDELLKKYPNSRHFEEAIRRLFAIGRYWLDSSKSAAEVELADFTSEAAEECQGELRESHAPGESALKLNFTDPSKPFIDTPGRAIQALRSVHLHDPSGPLAGDAVMILALYHLRKPDYGEAEFYFSLIRESYHRSEHLQAAYVLGAHACWKSYLESRNDGKQLEEAKKLTTAALRLFPDAPWRRQLKNQLQSIQAEEIERANAAKAPLN